MHNQVSYTRHARVGVMRIDNPPVNALGQAVRQGLLDSLREALDDDRAAVLVLLATGRTFIAGADIREFGKPPQSPLLPDVIKALEASTKPLIAVLHGTALGGGLEVALGCHLRIALAGTRIGLPEVKLGLLPGAGGTQRLPRLAGVECALDMITSGRFVAADEALTNGIVDAVVADIDPLQAGLAAAEKLLAGHYAPRRSGELPAPMVDSEVTQRYRDRLASDVPYLFSPLRCVDAIETACRLPFAAGLEHERELFRECMGSKQRAGMIHSFFAARGTHKVPGADAEASLSVLGLLGNHTLFEALATHAAKAGVRLIDLDDTSSEGIDACLVAPGVDGRQRQAIRDVLPSGTPWIDVTMPSGPPQALPSQPGDATLVLSPLGASRTTCELVDRTGNPALIQALANILKNLRRQVVVTRDKSVIAALAETLTRNLENNAEVQAVAWRAEGWDLSPWLPTKIAADDTLVDLEAARRTLDLAWQRAARALVDAGRVHRDSDIDVLATHAFGFPAHLGGPSFRAGLSG